MIQQQMAVPRSSEARIFYRTAEHRFEDATFLSEAGRTTGAVYLAGYTIECMLKALILESVPAGRRREVLRSFRGRQAYDFGWLRDQYLNLGGPSFPPEITQAFLLVSSWATDLRYQPASLSHGEAEAFLSAAETIRNWADGRL